MKEVETSAKEQPNPTKSQESSDGFFSGIADYFSKAESDGESSGKTNDGPLGEGSDGGDGDEGTADSGDGTGDGDGEFGSGGDGDGFEGEGMLTRAVVKRGNAKSVIRQNGKVVMNVCVDREGNVIYAKAEDRASTVKASYLRDFESLMKREYKYEKDYTASQRQCGRYKFSVSGIE